MKKKKWLLMLLMLASIWPAQVQAKKVKYGQYVLYDGKVKNNIPTGEGTLTTTTGATTDVLIGDFIGDGTVKNAQLKFPSGWKFTGNLSYAVEIDGSTVSYTLTEGELYIIKASVYKANVRDLTIKVSPDHPITLVRIPKSTSTILKTVVLDTYVPESEIDDDMINPLSISMVGDKTTCRVLANCTILSTSEVQNTSGAGTDVKQNLMDKGFANVSEPWTFLVRPSAIILSDNTTITKEEKDGKTLWTIQYANDDTFMYSVDAADETSSLKGLSKQFADGSSVAYLDTDEVSDTWAVNYTDKSKLKGKLCFKTGNVELTSDKKIFQYSINDVFTAFMKASSLEELHAIPYSATLTKDGNIIAEYQRGYSAEELRAKAEERIKKYEETGRWILQPSDVTGSWFFEDPKHKANYSYYLLTLNENGEATLQQSAVYFGDDKFNGPYYYRKTNRISGSYSLSDGTLVLNWKENSMRDGTLTPLYGTSDYNVDIQTVKEKAEKQTDSFRELIRTTLTSPSTKEYSDLQMRLSCKGQDLLLTRKESAVSFDQVLNDKSKDDGNIETAPLGLIESFTRHYDDGVVNLKDNEFTIEYSNGNKYVGTGKFAIFSNPSRFSNLEERKKMLNAILSLPSINDYEVYYINGTLTKADGSTLKFTNGLTEKQQGGLLENLQAAILEVEKLNTAAMAQMKQKAASAKATLLAEGYNASYVNSMFDHFRILNGTPRSLIDRAIQLGCHITRHKLVVNEVGSKNEMYEVNITNYNTGETAFHGFVRFYWVTDRVNYVGTSMP